MTGKLTIWPTTTNRGVRHLYGILTHGDYITGRSSYGSQRAAVAAGKRAAKRHGVEIETIIEIQKDRPHYSVY